MLPFGNIGGAQRRIGPAKTRANDSRRDRTAIEIARHSGVERPVATLRRYQNRPSFRRGCRREFREIFGRCPAATKKDSRYAAASPYWEMPEEGLEPTHPFTDTGF